MDSYKHITIEEREIGRTLGRSPSTISRELSRNNQNARYTPHKAQLNMWKTRQDGERR